MLIRSPDVPAEVIWKPVLCLGPFVFFLNTKKWVKSSTWNNEKNSRSSRKTAQLSSLILQKKNLNPLNFHYAFWFWKHSVHAACSASSPSVIRSVWCFFTQVSILGLSFRKLKGGLALLECQLFSLCFCLQEAYIGVLRCRPISRTHFFVQMCLYISCTSGSLIFIWVERVT